MNPLSFSTSERTDRRDNNTKLISSWFFIKISQSSWGTFPIPWQRGARTCKANFNLKLQIQRCLAVSWSFMVHVKAWGSACVRILAKWDCIKARLRFQEQYWYLNFTELHVLCLHKIYKFIPGNSFPLQSNLVCPRTSADITKSWVILSPKVHFWSFNPRAEHRDTDSDSTFSSCVRTPQTNLSNTLGLSFLFLPQELHRADQRNGLRFPVETTKHWGLISVIITAMEPWNRGKETPARQLEASSGDSSECPCVSRGNKWQKDRTQAQAAPREA